MATAAGAPGLLPTRLSRVSLVGRNLGAQKKLSAAITAKQAKPAQAPAPEAEATYSGGGQREGLKSKVDHAPFLQRVILEALGELPQLRWRDFSGDAKSRNLTRG